MESSLGIGAQPSTVIRRSRSTAVPCPPSHLRRRRLLSPPRTNLEAARISKSFAASRISGLKNNNSSCSEEEGEERWRREMVRTLLVDNYDSYTYNIYQELSVVNGVPPVVIRNDEWTWDEFSYWLFEEQAFDNIIISPGPGSPACQSDVGICLEILKNCKHVPILGVCLGHQALGLVHGAHVVHAPQPVHGRLSEIQHFGTCLFDGIPSGEDSGFKVVRYHSLVIDPASLPKDLIPTAWTVSSHTLSLLETQKSDFIANVLGCGNLQLQPIDALQNITEEQMSLSTTVDKMDNKKVVMGIMHSTRPHYGVQVCCIQLSVLCFLFLNFEQIFFWLSYSSILRVLLHLMEGSYLKISKRLRWTTAFSTSLFKKERFKIVASDMQRSSKLHCKADKGHYLDISMNSFLSDGAGIAKHLRLQWKKIDNLLSQVGGAENIFCELFGDKNAKDTFWLDSASIDQGRARYSFMGGKGGPLWKQITFQLSDKSRAAKNVGGYVAIRDAHGSEKGMFLKDGFFHFLKQELQSYHYDKEDFQALPFDFCGGFVGYIGYDLKVECGASSNGHKSKTPDACFFFADNLIAIDHSNGDVYILSLNDISQPHSTNRFNGSLNTWLEDTEKRLQKLKSISTRNFKMVKLEKGSSNLSSECFIVEKSRHQYIKDVERCLKFIKDGESYELCLTTQMRRRVDDIDALGLYLNLRVQNPAPYAALLNFARDDLCICCSSPERFLRLDRDGILEAKPIKGTIARGRTSEEDEHLKLQLQYSEKDQAENLMIVDLLRNDLGRVCEPGTVSTPCLMEVESYATVHTLVSTIQGKRKSDISPVDCVRAAFPGGSMTGAPKIRSMELLDSLESSSRGIYSGSIGFFSYNQTFDLNIVIRTVVIHNGEASVGAGGAIVALSNPEDEYAEMRLKAKAPTRVVDEFTRLSDHHGEHRHELVEQI